MLLFIEHKVLTNLIDITSYVKKSGKYMEYKNLVQIILEF